MRPHIFVTDQKIDGLKSVEEVQEGIRSGYSRTLWETIRLLADDDLKKRPLLPSHSIPGRHETEVRHLNRDWTIVNAAGQWVQRAALSNLITGDPRYRNNALRQLEILFDPKSWPEWRDLAHQNTEADLRTGMLSRDLSLAYDWLHPTLTIEQRKWILAGINQCGIQPYLRSLKNDAWWKNATNNWMTCIVGSLGITGMCLAEDHLQSQLLIEYSLPRLKNYLDLYGPEGEFNESVAYSSATLHPVAFFMAHRYTSEGSQNRLAQHPFPETCRWTMYLTLPPGRVADFGDSKIHARPTVAFFTAVADATHDGIIQGFYLNHSNPLTSPNLPWEFLWFNSNLQPVPAEGNLSKGRAFKAHSACISSRTNWDPYSTPCVVYGKGGHGSEKHGNHDAGQVCIDGYGERLIVDLGSPPGYPLDFFNSNRYAYYNASVKGHNVLTFGNREMQGSKFNQAKILAAEFDEQKGGYWALDLSELYDGIDSAKRTVVHFFPGIVVILDQANMKKEDEIVLRWHTAKPSIPNAKGTFIVQGEKATLSGQIFCLDSENLTFTSNQHKYSKPFNLHRLGDPLEQYYEPFIEARTYSNTCQFLSLFSVGPASHPVTVWKSEGNKWWIETQNGKVTVSLSEIDIEIGNNQESWKIYL